MSAFEPDKVCFVQDGIKHRSLLWHGKHFHGWPELLASLHPGDKAIASTGKHVHAIAARCGRKVKTRKRADGMLEIRCV